MAIEGITILVLSKTTQYCVYVCMLAHVHTHTHNTHTITFMERSPITSLFFCHLRNKQMYYVLKIQILRNHVYPVKMDDISWAWFVYFINWLLQSFLSLSKYLITRCWNYAENTGYGKESLVLRIRRPKFCADWTTDLSCVSAQVTVDAVLIWWVWIDCFGTG